MLCLRCGRERYEENWSPDERARQEPFGEDLREVVHSARALPKGVDTLAARPDPEFDAWFRSGRRPAWWSLGRGHQDPSPMPKPFRN